MPKLESDLLQSLERGWVGRVRRRKRKKVQWLEVSTRGWARGGASTRWPWLSSRAPAPAWAAGSRRSTRPPPAATRTCRPAPPASPRASAWWCVSSHLQQATHSAASEPPRRRSRRNSNTQPRRRSVAEYTLEQLGRLISFSAVGRCARVLAHANIQEKTRVRTTTTTTIVLRVQCDSKNTLKITLWL